MATTRPRRIVGIAVLLGAILGLTASCDSSSSTPQLDCATHLRFHGVIYIAFRFTDKRATKIGQAQPICFVANIHASPVAVWSFPGRSPSKVLGSKAIEGRLVIYVANSVGAAERSRILHAMTSGD